MTYTGKRTRRLAGLALLTGLVLVLQICATFFLNLGGFPITAALIPIVVGAALYGPAAGACLGAVFGIVTALACGLGLDPAGYILFTARPLMTTALCLLKGILAGWLPGLVYAALGRRHPTRGGFLASVSAPVVNTGVFAAGVVLFYPAVLEAWAGGTSVAYYLVAVLIGVNFLVEFTVNAVLSTVVVRVLSAYGHRNPRRR